MRVAVLSLALVIIGCSPPGDQGLAEQIRAASRTDDVIDLEALAPFEWDRVYIVQPYTTKEMFEAEGPEWPARWRWSSIDFKDDRVFLVFVLEGEIVSAFDYFGSLGSYACTQPRPEGIAPEEARFVVYDHGKLGRSILLEDDARECVFEHGVPRRTQP